VTPRSRNYEWIEQKIQARRFASSVPWHGGFLCNLSAPRSEAVYVDEAFHGWGFEDTEMAYRLAAIEGLEVYYEPAAVAYHLANLNSNPWMTRKSEDIVRYLRNMCYFLDKWPDAFGDYPMDLLPFDLDSESNTWSVVRAQTADFPTFVEKVRSWLKENGQYPPQA
jgi:GT2 family glycosyltransferase